MVAGGSTRPVASVVRLLADPGGNQGRDVERTLGCSGSTGKKADAEDAESRSDHSAIPRLCFSPSGSPACLSRQGFVTSMPPPAWKQESPPMHRSRPLQLIL